MNEREYYQNLNYNECSNYHNCYCGPFWLECAIGYAIFRYVLKENTMI